MARMMPPYCPNDAPPGEKALFEALSRSVETDGWIVLHSLALAAHVRQVEGEADFVVIAPGHGILVIEVKSHLTVERLPDGRWKLGVQAPTNRGPFQQAREAMYSISAYLKSRNVDLTSIPVLNALWFTHVRARTMLPNSPEWHRWQLLDSEDLRQGAPAAILRAFAGGAAHLDSRINGFSSAHIDLDDSTTTRIAKTLRPKFEMAVVAGDARRARESRLVEFVEEQYDALDNMQHNRAVLFTGPAGSGKTWLALEAARREVKLGRKGRLLCFNRFLGQRLNAQLAGVSGLQVGTFHQEAYRLSGLREAKAGAQFWDEEVPELALETLLDEGDGELDDFLIIDEMQDLAREPFLDVLDLLVAGGLKGGRVLMFGDFERQAIYEGGDGRAVLARKSGEVPSFELTVNCRNVPRIGAVVQRLSHMTPGYRRFRRSDDGIDPEFIPVGSSVDYSEALVKAVRLLRDDGYGLDEIVVLSPLRGESTAETTRDPWLRQVLSPADGQQGRAGQLRYATIHSFKGLDSPAVILTDLNDASAPNFDSLLYIGLTRATDRLVVLIEARTLRAAYEGKP